MLAPSAALARLAASTPNRRRILGIVGPPGAGKSTLARAVADAFAGAVLVPMDGFHLAQSVLDDTGLADRKGAPETFDRAGYTALLTRLRAQRPENGPIYAPEFRRTIEEPVAGAIEVRPDCPLVVTEGNYLLLWPEVRPLLDETWWVDLDPQERRARLTARHAAHGKTHEQAAAWTHGPDERNARLVAPGRTAADVIVRND